LLPKRMKIFRETEKKTQEDATKIVEKPIVIKGGHEKAENECNMYEIVDGQTKMKRQL